MVGIPGVSDLLTDSSVPLNHQLNPTLGPKDVVYVICINTETFPTPHLKKNKGILITTSRCRLLSSVIWGETFL